MSRKGREEEKAKGVGCFDGKRKNLFCLTISRKVTKYKEVEESELKEVNPKVPLFIFLCFLSVFFLSSSYFHGNLWIL